LYTYKDGGRTREINKREERGKKEREQERYAYKR
jgi:hypothetical protein